MTSLPLGPEFVARVGVSALLVQNVSYCKLRFSYVNEILPKYMQTYEEMIFFFSRCQSKHGECIVEEKR